MYSLQFLSMRKINDPEIIPKKYDFKRCCKIIDIEESIKYGHLECLKVALKNHGTERNVVYNVNENDYTIIASRYGQLNCLKFFHEKGYPCDEICSTSAEYGNLECLKYAHENKCPWNEHTIAVAVKNGNLECLKYAHENRCPWDILCQV